MQSPPPDTQLPAEYDAGNLMIMSRELSTDGSVTVIVCFLQLAIVITIAQMATIAVNNFVRFFIFLNFVLINAPTLLYSFQLPCFGNTICFCCFSGFV
jgi:hypothetical protein